MPVYPKVLVVEGDPRMRGAALELFEDAGAQVIEASDAERARAALASHSDTSMVFTSVRLPGDMSGLALALVLRTTHPNLKVVVTSGHLPDAAFGFPFVLKPWRRNEIAELVRTLAAVEPR